MTFGRLNKRTLNKSGRQSPSINFLSKIHVDNYVDKSTNALF